VLKQRREALPWTVTLDSLDDPKWGPEAVEIEPGDPDNGGCFGPLFAGCNFTAAEALTGAGLTSKRLCRAQPGDDGGFREIYAISAPGRTPGFATFDVDFGSGGETDTLMVTWDAGPPPCRSGEIGLTRSPP